MARKTFPVVLATLGKGKKTVTEFKTFIENHGAGSEQVLEVVCYMSLSFLIVVKDEFPKANVTVDWFHVVQLYTRAVDDVRKRMTCQKLLAGRVKEKLRWIREAKTTQANCWRVTNFIKFTLNETGSSNALEPVRKVLTTLEKHSERILQRWGSTYASAENLD